MPLTRTMRDGDCVAIGPDVFVTVVRISEHSVRLAIHAPRDTYIDGHESARAARDAVIPLKQTGDDWESAFDDSDL